MADKGGYIGRSPGDSAVIIARQNYSPTGVQTDFTFNSGYTPGYVDVYLNGVRLIDVQDYTASTGNTVGLTSYANNGDIVEVIAYKAFNIGNVSDATSNFTVGGNLTVSGDSIVSGGSTLKDLHVTGVSTLSGASYFADVTEFVSSGIVTVSNTTDSTSVTTGALQVSGGVGVALSMTVGGNLSVGGTITYEDVTNVDAIGIVTAQSGVNIVGGGLTVTGVGTFFSDIQVADKIIHTGDTNTAIRFPSADTITAETGGSERLRVTSAGKIEVKGTRAGALQASDDDTLKLYTASSDNSINRGSGITFYNHDNSGYEMGGTIQVAKENGTADNVAAYMRFSTTPAGGSATERLRIDSSGQLLLGHAASRAVGNITSQMQLEGTDASSGISICRNSNNASGPYISLAKSRAGAVGGTTVIQADDAVGSILFSGADGTDITNNAASIVAYIDATPGGNDTPGRLTFNTTADGGTSPTERLRIDSSGRLLLGTTTEGHSSADDLTIATSGHTGITLRSGTGSAGSIYFSDATSGGDEYNGMIIYHQTDNSMRFATNENERLRITSTGLVGIGTDSPARLLSLEATANNDGILIHAGGNHYPIFEFDANRSGAGGNCGQFDFKWNGTGITRIATLTGADTTNKDDGHLAFFTASAGSLSERLRITSGGCVYASNFGIGTDDRWKIRGNNSNADMAFEYATSSTLADSNIKMVLKSTGRVGVGTNQADTVLSVYGDNNTVWPFTADVSNTYAYSPYTHELQVKNLARDVTGAFAGIYFHSGASADGSYVSAARIAAVDTGNYKSDLVFGTRNTAFRERVRITAAGNLGIGTDNPANFLHVENGANTGNTYIHVENSHSGGGNAGVKMQNVNGQWTIIANDRLRFYNDDGSAEPLSISSANVIGANTPTTITDLHTNYRAVQNHNYGVWSTDDGGASFFSNNAYTNTAGNWVRIANDHASDFGMDDGVFYFRNVGAGTGTITWNTPLTIAANAQITYQAASGDNQIISKRTDSAGSNGNYFFHFTANNSDDNAVGAFGFHRYSATDDSAFKVFTRNTGGSNSQRLIIHNTVSTFDTYFQAFEAQSDAQYDGINYSFHKIQTSNNNWTLGVENSNDSQPYGLLVKFSDVSPDNNTNKAYEFTDNSATRFVVYSDGDVWTSDAGTLTSDETLKENITDATSKLEDIKKLKVRNFNWKSSFHPEKSKKKQIGFIAQEVEEVFPALVNEYDISPDAGDQDHTPIMKKSIKAAWDPIIIKAMQELITKVETLEAEVAALKSS